MKAARITSLVATLLSALVLSACSKSEPTATVTAPASAPVAAKTVAASAPAASTPASPAPSADVSPERDLATAADALAGGAAVPAAAPAAPATPAPIVATAAAAAAAPPAPAAAPGVVDREAARKKEQIEWALKQDEIKSDPNGQWAKDAKASSTFNDATGSASYAASQATGEPNVQVYSTTPQAWSSKTADAGIEWLELTFAKPVQATAVRVRESSGSGAVIKIDVFDEKGAGHTVWSGTDSTKDLNYLVAEFPKTTFKTNRVKLTLATNVVSGWNQIDAVQLVGTDR
jgi:hypothetical protein